MKAEITLENKAKFFAQYYGSSYIKPNGRAAKISTYAFMGEMAQGNSQLILTHLSLLTDKDAFEVVEIVKLLGMVSTAMRDPQSFLEPMKRGEGTVHIVSPVTDYLRSKGYALPWMGLSVDEMVQAGWIKPIEL